MGFYKVCIVQLNNLMNVLVSFVMLLRITISLPLLFLRFFLILKMYYWYSNNYYDHNYNNTFREVTH